MFSNKVPALKIPELIDRLAKTGEFLRWDHSKNWYEVMDGREFEIKFNELRCIRGKRKENAADRPFARMHIHFVLVRGEKWAGTGSAFRPKSMVSSSRQELRSEELQFLNQCQSESSDVDIVAMKVENENYPSVTPSKRSKSCAFESNLLSAKDSEPNAPATCDLQVCLLCEARNHVSE